MFRKVMQMIQDYAEKKLLDEVFATYLDVQDAAAEMAQVLPCPRCGKLTMKMRLHSNALSRQVPGIAICDRCGIEEALEDAVRRPMDVHKWALERSKPQMKRREKKLSVMDWVLVGLLDTLAGVVAGGLMAIWQLPSAYRWRGYWAIGGEWLLVIIAIIMAVRLTHAFQMFMIFGGKKHGKMRSVSQGHYRSSGNRSGVRRKVLRQGVRQEAEIARKTSQGKDRYTA